MICAFLRISGRMVSAYVLIAIARCLLRQKKGGMTMTRDELAELLERVESIESEASAEQDTKALIQKIRVIARMLNQLLEA